MLRAQVACAVITYRPALASASAHVSGTPLIATSVLVSLADTKRPSYAAHRMTRGAAPSRVTVSTSRDSPSLSYAALRRERPLGSSVGRGRVASRRKESVLGAAPGR